MLVRVYQMRVKNKLRWDDLKVVLSLARHGSLKRAAADLGVNISTVSRRLDGLEASLGRHLFDRTPDGTWPTAATEQLLPFAEAMAHAAGRFLRALDGLEDSPEGLVRVAAPPGLVNHFLVPAVRDVRARYPRLRIEVLSSIGYASLTRREADIALRSKRPTSGDLIASRLGAYHYVVLATEKQAAHYGRLRDPEQASWTSWDNSLSHLPEAKWLAKQVSRERIVVTSNSMTLQLEAVRHHIALMLAPAPYAALPDICALPLSKALAASVATISPARLWLVGHRALRDVPRITAVWRGLQQAIGGLPHGL